jgi:glycosyltransferase involved in cell wall biosynthesis
MTLASVDAMEKTIQDLTNRSLVKDWEIWWREKMLTEKVWTPRTYKDQLLEHWEKLESHALAMNSTKPQMKTLVNFIHRQIELEDDDHIVITMQASASPAKLDNVILNLRKWDGPGSIALYIQSSEDVDLISSWLSNHTIAWYLRASNVHVLMEKIVDFSPYPEAAVQWTYPYNALRNLALENTGSNYFLLLDVDLIVTPDSHATIRRLMRKDPQIVDKMRRKRTLFVLPAFEVCPGGINYAPEKSATESDLPNSKRDLINMVEKNAAWVIYHDVTPKNQGSTKSEKWYNFTEAPYYSIDWELAYEPYVIGYLPGIPRFWTAIRGYGYDKVSWFHELHRAGYAMNVLRDLYVVHLCHPRTPIKVDWEKWPNTRKFIEFDPFLMAKYGNCRDWCSTSPDPWSTKCGWDSCAQCSDCITDATCPDDCKNNPEIAWEERCAWETCVGKCPACLQF